MSYVLCKEGIEACHSERSEGSKIIFIEILCRFAQTDKF